MIINTPTRLPPSSHNNNQITSMFKEMSLNCHHNHINMKVSSKTTKSWHQHYHQITSSDHHTTTKSRAQPPMTIITKRRWPSASRDSATPTWHNNAVNMSISTRPTSAVHLYRGLSYDRSTASSTASSPHSAIQRFIFQFTVSSFP
jgi:hypothetical protein